MYKVNLMRSPKATYDWIDLDLFGTPGFIFLTDEKYWRMK
jgi:tRNA G26 N,N-dimethylase Trm1